MAAPCANKEGECVNDYDCGGKLVCGEQDKTCKTNCSIDHCGLDEGVCLSNDECMDTLICGLDEKCRGNQSVRNIVNVLIR